MRLHYTDCIYRHIFSEEKRNKDKGERIVQELLFCLTNKKPWCTYCMYCTVYLLFLSS